MHHGAEGVNSLFRLHLGQRWSVMDVVVLMKAGGESLTQKHE